MNASVIIPAWNGAAHLQACLDSVMGQTHRFTHAIVVDDASRDDTAAIAAGFEARSRSRGCQLRTISLDQNVGFTRAANIGIAAAMGATPSCDVLVLLNQDATVDAAWLECVLRVFADDHRAGVVGAKLLYPDRLTIQHAGGFLERPRLVGRHFGHHETNTTGAFEACRPVEYVTAAAMALRAAAVREVGPFEEAFSPGYYEDVDLCHRMRQAGWGVIYCPDAVGTHIESSAFADRTRRLRLSHRNRLIFAMRFFADSRFFTAFHEAERAILSQPLPPEERRALAFGYLSMLLTLPSLLASRAFPPDRRAALGTSVSAMLSELRVQALATRRTRSNDPG